MGIQQYREDESPCPQVVVSAEEKKESDGVKRKGAARGTGSGTYIRWQGKAGITEEVMPESRAEREASPVESGGRFLGGGNCKASVVCGHWARGKGGQGD